MYELKFSFIILNNKLKELLPKTDALAILPFNISATNTRFLRNTAVTSIDITGVETLVEVRRSMEAKEIKVITRRTFHI